MLKHICGPGCVHGVTPEAEEDVKEEFKTARRSFLRDAMVAGGGAVSVGALGVSMAPRAFAQSATPGQGMASHYFIPANANTVLWGYFSKSAKPVVEVESGDYIVALGDSGYGYGKSAEELTVEDLGRIVGRSWESQAGGKGLVNVVVGVEASEEAAILKGIEARMAAREREASKLADEVASLRNENQELRGRLDAIESLVQQMSSPSRRGGK